MMAAPHCTAWDDDAPGGLARVEKCYDIMGIKPRTKAEILEDRGRDPGATGGPAANLARRKKKLADAVIASWAKKEETCECLVLLIGGRPV